MVYDVAIAGAGVIGGMLARELSKYELSVVVLEKENDVAMGASKANSGIVHGGFDPEPDTLKARLNAEGVEKLFEAAKKLHAPIKRNGSLVCAFGEEEETAIYELYERGIKNGIPELSVISGDEARALEPNLSNGVTLALRVDNSGIVCPYELTVAAIGNAMDNGAELIRNFSIEGIEKAQDGIFSIKSQNGKEIKAKYIANCAGCRSDKIAKLLGDSSFEIIPRKGEYMLLDKSEGGRTSRTIFQVPTAAGKGILVSPTVDSNLLIGPTAEISNSPDNKCTTPCGLEAVIKGAKKSVPSVDIRRVITSFTGVRSSTAGGDFIIEMSRECSGLLNVAAIDSPGLTCCVSIAEYAVEVLKNAGLELIPKPHFNGNRENPHLFREMNDTEKNVYIKQNPDYGKIVCRCETVSEGEIRAAICRNPKPMDIDGVKRRTRSGMGRCQGGFCAPFVMKLIAEENGIEIEDVTKSGEGSNMVIGRI